MKGPMWKLPSAEKSPRSKPGVPEGPKPKKSERLKALMPDIWALVKPRRGLLGAGLVLMRISPLMTILAFSFLLGFGIVLNKAFGTIRPIFRERGKINAEVTGRLTESLGGVRVVKGYHAEEREEKVFGAGVDRLLMNVMRTLTAMSSVSLSSTLLMGSLGAAIMYLGATEVIAGR